MALKGTRGDAGELRRDHRRIGPHDSSISKARRTPELSLRRALSHAIPAADGAERSGR